MIFAIIFMTFQGRSWGVESSSACDPHFCKFFLSKQPTKSGKNDMAIWGVPSLWHTVAHPLKNSGYVPAFYTCPENIRKDIE